MACTDVGAGAAGRLISTQLAAPDGSRSVATALELAKIRFARLPPLADSRSRASVLRRPPLDYLLSVDRIVCFRLPPRSKSAAVRASSVACFVRRHWGFSEPDEHSNAARSHYLDEELRRVRERRASCRFWRWDRLPASSARAAIFTRNQPRLAAEFLRPACRRGRDDA